MTPPSTRGIPRTFPRIPRAYTFTAVGQGPFPIDMLRYDICRPASENDSHQIERSYDPRDHAERYIKLIGPKVPTEGRWASFGWTVKSVS